MVGAASAAAASFPIVHARARLSQPDCVERRSRIGAVDSKPLADGDPKPYVAVAYDDCFKAITPGSSVDPARGATTARSVRLSAQDTPCDTRCHSSRHVPSAPPLSGVLQCAQTGE